jgi:hypothetical protein
MTGSRDRRLARLERNRRSRTRILYLWRDDPTESAAAAITRSFPKGPPPGTQLVICSWQGPASDPAIDPSDFTA